MYDWSSKDGVCTGSMYGGRTTYKRGYGRHIQGYIHTQGGIYRGIYTPRETYRGIYPPRETYRSIYPPREAKRGLSDPSGRLKETFLTHLGG